MAPRRRISIEDGHNALTVWRSAPDDAPRPTVATAVRFALEELEARAPGRSVEVRVPPFGAVQCIEGPRHTRGTPPNVIETDASTWLRMVTGQTSWAVAETEGSVRASGQRAVLAGLLPLFERE